MRRLTAALLLLTLVLAACGDDGDDGSTDDGNAPEVTVEDLDGHRFVSTSSTGHELVADTVVSLTFAEGRISANAGCNTQNGDVEVADGRLQLTSELASTMMGCEEPLMDQDQWVAAFLEAGPTVALDGDVLTLTADDETLELSAES